MRIENLCNTICGIKVPIVTISNPRIPDQKKKVIFVNARAHPGEPQTTWIAEGLIDFLTQDSKVTSLE